jgi:CDGSH iron-sulfur domain-containing protein 3
MSDPVIVQKEPYPMNVEEGKNYFWCACGKSSKQPLCDGSHKGTGLAPIKFTAPKDQKVYFCGLCATAPTARSDSISDTRLDVCQAGELVDHSLAKQVTSIF